MNEPNIPELRKHQEGIANMIIGGYHKEIIKLHKSIYDEYITEFGEINLLDPDLNENIADLICEKKKLSKTEITNIVTNIEKNIKLIDLNMNNIPTEIVEKMEEIYGK